MVHMLFHNRKKKMLEVDLYEVEEYHNSYTISTLFYGNLNENYALQELSILFLSIEIVIPLLIFDCQFRFSIN